MTLYKTIHDVKTLEIEEASDKRLRLVLTLQKLGVTTKLDFFIDVKEAKEISLVLHKVADISIE